MRKTADIVKSRNVLQNPDQYSTVNQGHEKLGKTEEVSDQKRLRKYDSQQCVISGVGSWNRKRY